MRPAINMQVELEDVVGSEDQEEAALRVESRFASGLLR